MLKKIISLSLCLLMLIPVFAGCAGKAEDDKGAYISMYITEPVYNFDPARAYGNESALKIVSLMFDNLFVLNEKGKVEKSLVKDYEIIENEKNEKNKEYKMLIELNKTYWSDGTILSANDVVYAWKRILDPSNSFDAAVLLYDIMYAKEVKEGEKSIDEVRISALNTTQIEIQFTGKIDYDRFLLNLTSYSLAPVRENVINDVVDQNDWAKKPSMFVASGPFKLREISYEEGAEGLILERNPRYYRNEEKDALDKYVTPYRLIVDYTMTDDEIMQAYENGELFYIGNIPLSVRGDWKDSKDVNKSSALSTHAYVLNQNAIIRYYDEAAFATLAETTTFTEELTEENGEKLFANATVRQALSLAINRDKIAELVVFAEAATGLVPPGVFNSTSKKQTFRDNGSTLISSDFDKADAMLKKAGITASNYMFTISVPAYDEVHMAIANEVQAVWSKLGFNVAVKAIDVVDNTDISNTTEEIINGIKDDIFAENYLNGAFEVAAIDYVAPSVDAFSVLAPFAKGFTGGAANKANSPVFSIPAHITGYNSEAYNNKITEIYNTTDSDARATLLHEAEKILMEDMPIIPIVYNVNATLISKELSKEEFTYYGTPVFTKLKLKNYLSYIPVEESETDEESDT